MPETIRPREDELQQLENRIQEVKNEIGCLGDDEKAQYDWFLRHPFGLGSFWRKIQTGDENNDSRIAERQQEMRDWLQKNYGYKQLACEPEKTRVTSRTIDFYHIQGVVFPDDYPRAEGVVAEVISQGFQFKDKPVQKAIVKVYAYKPKKL